MESIPSGVSVARKLTSVADPFRPAFERDHGYQRLPFPHVIVLFGFNRVLNTIDTLLSTKKQFLSSGFFGTAVGVDFFTLAPKGLSAHEAPDDVRGPAIRLKEANHSPVARQAGRGIRFS